MSVYLYVFVGHKFWSATARNIIFSIRFILITSRSSLSNKFSVKIKFTLKVVLKTQYQGQMKEI